MARLHGYLASLLSGKDDVTAPQSPGTVPTATPDKHPVAHSSQRTAAWLALAGLRKALSLMCPKSTCLGEAKPKER